MLEFAIKLYVRGAPNVNLYYYIKIIESSSSSSSSANHPLQAGTLGHNVGRETLSQTPYLVFRKTAVHPPESGSEVVKIPYRFIRPYIGCRQVRTCGAEDRALDYRSGGHRFDPTESSFCLNQGKSMKIRGNQGKSGKIRGNQGKFEEIRGNQGKFEEIRGNQGKFEEIRGNQGKSGKIKENQEKSKKIDENQGNQEKIKENR